jgi:triacylglycerol lipase
VTKVPPIAGIEARASRLGEQIAAAYPDEPVHLIGHSMGGLDARMLLADPEWGQRILSLTTIGTPHLGSPIADFAQFKVGQVYRLLTALKIDHRGFLDVTQQNAREFHGKFPAPETVRCFSVAGNPTVEEVCWPLQRLYLVLSELDGPNDGLVSVDSALAFGTPLPHWPVDHFRQMNWMVPEPDAKTNGAGTPVQFYAEVVTNLARLGFAAADAAEDEPAPSATLPAPIDSTSASGDAGILQVTP